MIRWSGKQDYGRWLRWLKKKNGIWFDIFWLDLGPAETCSNMLWSLPGTTGITDVTENVDVKERKRGRHSLLWSCRQTVCFEIAKKKTLIKKPKCTWHESWWTNAFFFCMLHIEKIFYSTSSPVFVVGDRERSRDRSRDRWVAAKLCDRIGMGLGLPGQEVNFFRRKQALEQERFLKEWEGRPEIKNTEENTCVAAIIGHFLPVIL